MFGTGSLPLGVRHVGRMLIGTRALMGIGGACIMPATLSIITNVFTDPSERGKAIGVWAGVSALGVGLGPVAGGVLLDALLVGSVFLVNVPIVVDRPRRSATSSSPTRATRPRPGSTRSGAVLSIAGLGALLWAIIEAPGPRLGLARDRGRLRRRRACCWRRSCAWELHSSSPCSTCTSSRTRAFSAASGAITLSFFALFGTIFLLTQYLQSVLGYSHGEAGAVLLPQAGHADGTRADCRPVVGGSATSSSSPPAC